MTSRILRIIVLGWWILLPWAAHADPPVCITESAYTSSGNSVATIGSTLYYVLYAQSDSPVNGWVQQWAAGPNMFFPVGTVLAPQTYAGTFTYVVTEAQLSDVTAANGIKSPIQYVFNNTSSPAAIVTRAAVSQATIDNIRPKTLGGMTVTVNGGALPAGGTKKGDLLRFSQQMDAGAFQSVPTAERAYLDLSTLNLTNSYQMTAANPHACPTDIVASGLIDANRDINFTAIDPYGNTLATIGMTIPVDTIVPVIIGATATVNGTAKAYDPATVTVTLQGYDVDTVVGSCTYFSATPFNLVYLGGNQFQGLVNLRPSPPMAAFTGNTLFDITVTDNAGNISTKTTNIVPISNVLPNLADYPNASLTELISPTTDNIGIINDQIIFTASATFGVTQNVKLFVDLTPIGGPVSVELPPVGGGLFTLVYTIPKGTAENIATRSFKITAQDQNPPGNVVASWTTPGILIDNLPPVFTSVNLTRISGTGPSYKIGDQFKIAAVVQNLAGTEPGAVSVSVGSLSSIYVPGPTVLTRNLVDQTLFESNFTVGSYSTEGDGYDAVITFALIASDAQGNTATSSVSSVSTIDNQFPDPASFAASFTYVHDPGTLPDAGYVRIGDRLDFTIFVGNPKHLDLNAVRIDLSPLGLGVQTMTDSGFPGTMTYTVTDVPAGTLDRVNQPFSISVNDNNGNAATATVIVPIDNLGTAITNVVITDLTIPANKILYGDSVTVAADIANITSTANGSVTVDLSKFGYATDTGMAYSGVGTTWSITFSASNSRILNDQIDTTTWQFALRAFDNSGNIATASSGNQDVDNEPPILAGSTDTTASFTVVPGLSSSHPYVRIGDLVTLWVKLATSTVAIHDGETVVVDLSSMVGTFTSTQTMTYSTTSHLYEYRFAVTQGPLNNGATFPLTIKDDDGNVLWDLTNLAVPVISDASITMPLDHLPPQPTGPLTMTLTNRGLWTEDPGLPPSTVNLNRVLNATWPVDLAGWDNGSCTIDLSFVGSSTVASMVWDLSSMYYNVHLASSTGVTSDTANYRFVASMTDKAGNLIATRTTQTYIVDCIPPIFTAASVTILTPPGATIATVGTMLRFRCSIQNAASTELLSGYPAIDLQRIGGAGNQAMNRVSNTDFTLDWPVAQAALSFTGYNNSVASFLITCQDNACNQAVATASTASVGAFVGFTVYNVPASGSLRVVDPVTQAPLAGAINIGRDLLFILDIDPLDVPNIVTTGATINLTAIGSSSVATFTWDPASVAFVLYVTAATATVEFSPFEFSARVKDVGGTWWTYSTTGAPVTDCLPPRIVTSGIAISQTNGDNPTAWVANVNDVITVFASFSLPLDFTANATLSSGATLLETQPMVYIAGLDRYEASFTVTTDVGAWGALNLASLTYGITAADDVGNLASPVSALSTLAVDNVAPTFASVAWAISPNAADVLYLNVASDSPPDLLWASASLNPGELATAATLDLSTYPSGPGSYVLSLFGDNARTVAGINLANYSRQDAMSQTFTLTMADLGGNFISTSSTFLIDTQRPTLQAATFDGATLSVDVSEFINTFDINQWDIIGSATTGLLASISLDPTDTESVGVFTFAVQLSMAHRRTITSWASTPLYLRPRPVEAAPLSDPAGNWEAGETFFPITLTSSTWREKPKVTGFTVTQFWPASIVIDLTFNRPMDPLFVSASEGILLSATETAEFDSAAYEYQRYILQVGSETFTWPTSTQLRIDLGPDGRDWVARRLGSGTTPLGFATRNSARGFVTDDLGNNLTHIPTTSPWWAAVTRPLASNYAIMTPPNPVIDLTNRVLSLQTSDRTLLYDDPFRTLPVSPPQMGMPIPSVGRAFNTFQGKVELHDLNAIPATYAVLTLSPLSLTSNPDLSTTTIRLDLADADVVKIFALFNNNVNPGWGLRIQPAAFINWWGQPNQIYLPPGPGSVDLATPAVGLASFVACAFSDPPPTGNVVPGGLTFECEFDPVFLGNVPILLGEATPTGRIVGSQSQFLASGTFLGWTTRLVNGKERSIARFQNTTAFPADLQLWEARVELFNVADSFGNTIAATSTDMAYDLAGRTTTGTGFTAASMPIIIDTASPTVIAFTPNDYVPLLAPGTNYFQVDFSEAMDQTAGSEPVLTLATTGTTLTFTFAGWAASSSARYSNDQDITRTLPNGTWTYSIAGGQDEAGNPLVASTASVQVRTNGPEILSTSFQTIQGTLDGVTVLTGQPFSPVVTPGAATLTFTYLTAPQNLPNYARFYDGNNILIASSPLAYTAPLVGEIPVGAAQFANPGLVGPSTYSVRIRDSAGNETGVLQELIYDSASPDLDLFEVLDLSGIGTFSGGVFYYSPTVAGMDLRATIHSTNASDALRLAAFALSVNATSTSDFTQTSVGTYTIDFGQTFAPGTYTLSVADAAGNLQTGSPSILLEVDATAPTVLAIVPSSPPSVQGPVPGNGATYTVTFSEPLDTANPPTLELGNGVATITMTAAVWADPNNATTAWYMNAVQIISPTFPTGTYTYLLAGGRDRAGNALDIAIPAGSQELYVQTTGPTPFVTIYTEQPEIFGVASLANNHFSPLVVPGVATFAIRYTGYQGAGNHDLVLFNAGVPVATITFDPPDTPGAIEISTDTASWLAFGGVGAGPATYAVLLHDQYGNYSPYGLASLTYDSLPATLTAFDLADGNRGMATDGIRFYSPRLGNASITLTTTATDPLRLIVASGTATEASTILQAPTYSVATGAGLADGLYLLTAADLAGNMVQGVSSITIQADSASPTVTLASPSIGAGIPELGVLAAGSGTFEITFNEPMNTNSTPLAALISATATPPTIITLSLATWTSPTMAVFTNDVAITAIMPQGTYTYQVVGATDLAGNQNVSPASGTFNLQIRSTGPNYAATLQSQQTLITTDTVLIDQPFSPLAPPNVASLSISYWTGPYGIPHQVLVFDPSDVQVQTVPVTIVGTVGTATVFAAAPDFFFGNPAPGLTGPTTYSIRIQDRLGNISTIIHQVVYDSLAPDVSSFSITRTSDATPSQDILYYNDQIQGQLTFTVRTTNANDPLKLVIASGTATPTYPLTAAGLDHSTSLTLTAAAGFPEGSYGITAVDLAGNFATGTAWAKTLIIDRTRPTVLSVVTNPVAPLHSLASGAATFTVTFSEPMNQLTATPTLVLATGAQSLATLFTGWANASQATFVLAQPISEGLPQGAWNTTVTGTDLAKNPVGGNFPSIDIQSRGPIVTAFAAYSFQATTASGVEILVDRPFSFAVAPGAATLSMSLSQAPASTPVFLQFIQAGITVASFQVPFSPANAGTFTWTLASGPVPAAPSTYQIKLADGFGNLSRESYSWTEDASAPVVMSPAISGGITATNAVYFNPALQGPLSVSFDSVETTAPYLRARSGTTTDTYQMAAAGPNRWTGSFDGTHSRGGIPKPTAPDGVYTFDLVDAAGNVGVPTFGGQSVATGVLDTKAPVIATYATLVNGQPRSRFAPSAASLAIVLTTAEPLSLTGVWWVEVRTDANTYVNRLPLVASGAQRVAWWNGTKEDGSTVIDGTYRFYAMDFTRNPASTYTTVFAITSPFRLLSATEVTSRTVDLAFNHQVDPTSLPTAIISVPGQIVATATLISATQIRLALTPGLQDAIPYNITVVAGTLRSLEGATIASPNNVVTLVADAQGPYLTGVSYQGLVGQKDFMISFNEKVTPATAQNPNNYRLESGGVLASIASAIITADQTSVILTATANLVESQGYVINAIGVEDVYRNPSVFGVASWTFVGRDLTPPVFELAAFSNPANEFDLIVVAKSNEALQAAPSLRVSQSGSSEVQTTMIQGSSANSYMAGVHLNTTSRNGSLMVTGTDLSGNTGTKSDTFSVAYVAANVRAEVRSPDGKFAVEFEPGSLKKATLVTILPHRLEQAVGSTSSRIALPPVLGNLVATQSSRVLGNKVVSKLTGAPIGAGQGAELAASGLGYELGMPGNRLNGPIALSIAAPTPTASAGLGLFRYDADRGWVFLSRTWKDGKLVGKADGRGTFAILRDRLAPRLNLKTQVDPGTPFRTTRPEFAGRVEEAGSGLDADGLVAVLDNGMPQPVLIQADGSFTFIPLAALTGGQHSLTFQARDRTGNLGMLSAIRFAVAVPLQIGEIVTYPNPASRRATLRISANRDDIAEGLVEVHVYDVSGHKVRTLTGVKPVKEAWGASSRFLYDIPWDLTDEDGDGISNGVYIAKVVLTDPDNGERRIRQTHKIAVLR